MAPSRLPFAAGVKVTLMRQLPPAGTLDAQVLVCAKSPALTPVGIIPLMFRATPPVLVRVIGCDPLCVPTRCLPKLMLDGTSCT